MLTILRAGLLSAALSVALSACDPLADLPYPEGTTKAFMRPIPVIVGASASQAAIVAVEAQYDADGLVTRLDGTLWDADRHSRFAIQVDASIQWVYVDVVAVQGWSLGDASGQGSRAASVLLAGIANESGEAEFQMLWHGLGEGAATAAGIGLRLRVSWPNGAPCVVLDSNVAADSEGRLYWNPVVAAGGDILSGVTHVGQVEIPTGSLDVWDRERLPANWYALPKDSVVSFLRYQPLGDAVLLVASPHAQAVAQIPAGEVGAGPARDLPLADGVRLGSARIAAATSRLFSNAASERDAGNEFKISSVGGDLEAAVFVPPHGVFGSRELILRPILEHSARGGDDQGESVDSDALNGFVVDISGPPNGPAFLIHQRVRGQSSLHYWR